MRREAISITMAILLAVMLIISAAPTAYAAQAEASTAPTTSALVVQGIDPVVYEQLAGDGSEIVQYSCSNNYMALLDDGSLWIWGGSALHDKLGPLYDTDVWTQGEYGDAPQKLMDDVAGFTQSQCFAAVIKSDGSLWCWGRNDYGQVGNGEYGDVATPVKVLEDVKYVTANDLVVAAICSDDSLWTWGDQSEAGYGWASDINSNTPHKVMENVSSVCLGGWHVGAIKTDGSLWMWGANEHGQCGYGWDGYADVEFDDGASVSATSQYLYKPYRVLENVESVGLAGLSSYALKDDGTLWHWGISAEGNDITKPTMLMSSVASFAASDYHVLAITQDGKLYAMGNDLYEYGILGTGERGNSSATPIEIMENIIDVNCTSESAVALNADGDAYAWGNIPSIEWRVNSYGERYSIWREDPVIDAPEKLVTGIHHIVSQDCYGNMADVNGAVKNDGTLWLWGNTYSLTPERIELGKTGTKHIGDTRASMAKATITLSQTSYDYDGSAHKPSVTVTLDGKTLVEGADYTVTYSNNTDIGTGSVTVKGIGDYAGIRRVEFEIAGDIRIRYGAASSAYECFDHPLEWYMSLASSSVYNTKLAW